MLFMVMCILTILYPEVGYAPLYLTWTMDNISFLVVNSLMLKIMLKENSSPAVSEKLKSKMDARV
jgi:hypothetical protein